jgi:hypothetical protein
MVWFSKILVEPFYRLIYGRPLEDSLPFEDETAARGDGDVTPRAERSGDDSPYENRAFRGLVLVADGVGGLNLCATALRYVMGAERLPYAIRVVPWGHGLGRWFSDLTNTANRDARASEVAAVIRRFRAWQPADPVFLVAKSGGAGVMVKALELLAGTLVERAILLSPALSPAYDMTAALRGVRREMVVFWSPLDVILLGAGTRVFGTVDRVWTASAGMVGFRLPPSLPDDREQGRQYAKLRQVRWALQMAATGYLGGHFGPDSPLFLKRYVVPLLRGAAPNSC